MIAISAGNHAAAVAVAAGLLGVHAVVVMPTTAVRSKIEACRGYGAEVILEGEDTAEAWAAMERIRDERRLTFVHPFAHLATMAGQGTVGLEIVEDLPDVDVVVAGVGGGGMACGVAAAVKGRRLGARVYGVEPRTSNALSLGIAAGTAGRDPPGQRRRRPERALRQRDHDRARASLSRRRRPPR